MHGQRVRRSVLTAVSLVLLCLWAAPGLRAQDQGSTLLYEERFEGEPAGWELEPGWRVEREGDNGTLRGEGHRWARHEGQYGNDLTLRFRIKLQRGTVHLVVRLNDRGRYFIGLHERGSYLSKQLWPDTFLEGLAESTTEHALGAWHEVEIAAQGEAIRFSVDGVQEWAYADPDPLLGGSFAFETLEESAVQIDDVRAYGPAPTPTPTPDTRLSWIRVGGPLGGLGYDVRMRPDNPDVMYVTDAWAGVFVSEDGGTHWFPSNEGIIARAGESGDAIPVFCLTIDPQRADRIWAGTQNVRGIYRSDDGGRTWVEMDQGVVEREGITFRGFAIDPRSSDTVYAAAELSSWVWAGQPRPGREFDMTGGVVYKTTDGGQTWRAAWRGDNLARYVWIDPRDPEVLYLSTGIFDREAANSDPAGRVPGGEGVLKSTDGGETWAHANQGLGNLYVGTLFMHPTNPDILLAGTGNNQYYDGNGIYLSEDGARSWQRVLADDNITAVEFSTSDPRIAYAGSAVAVYRSEDGGRAWARVSGGEEGWGPPGVRAGFPIDLQVDPRDPDRIFANEYGGGNLLSTDGGRTWRVASAGYTGAQVRDIAVDAEGRVYAAARSGLFRSDDGGATWRGLSIPPAYAMEWYVVAVDPGDARHVLAANNWNGVLLQSQDRGEHWRVAGPPAGEGMGWRALAYAPSDTATVYAGISAYYSAGTFDDRMPAGGIAVSHDGGRTWSMVNDATSQEANVTAIAVHPSRPQVAYAATGNAGVLKTADGGGTWQAINQGLPGSPSVLAVRIHPTEPEVLYAGLAFGGLYRSEDGGASWMPSSDGLIPEATVSDLIFDPGDLSRLYLADRSSGVYRSLDGGRTWTAINVGLRTRAVGALALTADGAHVYAATEGEGVYRLDLQGRAPGSVREPEREEAVTPTPSPRPTQKPPTVQAAGATPTASPSAGATSSPTPGQGRSGGLPCPGAVAGAVSAPLLGAAVLLRRRRVARDRL